MLDWFGEIFNKFGGFLYDVLPHSPFTEFLSDFANLPFLEYLNWFIPVRSIIRVCELWLLAISLFYLYSIIMRWVKMIGD